MIDSPLPKDHWAPYRASSDRWLFYALLVFLVWAPLPLGSNRPWARVLLEVGIFGLAMALFVLTFGARVWLTSASTKARFATAALVLWLGLGLLQLLPLPLYWLTVLSLSAAGQWTATSLALDDAGAPGYAPLSMGPQGSLIAWRLGLALTGIFLLVLLLVRSRRRLRLLAGTLVIAAVAQAILASLLALTGASRLFIDAAARAHGTFINPNRLAGYLEMAIALGIGLLVADLSEPGQASNWRKRLRACVRTLLGRKARLRIYLAILVIALVMTASRMGNTAFFISLVVAGAIGALSLRRSPWPVLILLVSLVMVDVLILGTWSGLDRVRERLEQIVLTEDAQYQLGVRATAYLSDYRWFGSRGGSFYAVYPAYRNAESIPLHSAHADNDLLEFQLEYGVVGVVPLTIVVLLSVAAALYVLFSRDDALCRGMAFASLMGIAAILIHSAVDANLHIPANAALFMILLALPWLGLTLGRDRG